MILGRSTQIALGTLRPLMKYLEVFNLENLHGSRKEVLLNVCKMIGLFLFLLEVAITMLFGVWFCVNYNFDLELTATPISIILYCVQLLLVCVSFMLKNRKIDATFDRIQTIINQSKLIKYIPAVPISFNSIFVLFQGVKYFQKNLHTTSV